MSSNLSHMFKKSRCSARFKNLNFQIFRFGIFQNLEESMKNFDENTKIVFLDQLKWKFSFFWIFEVLELWAGDRDTVVHHHWPINKNPNLGFPSSNETKINCFWINLLWLIIMTQNHVLLRIIPRLHSENPGRSLKVIENWYMIGFEIKTLSLWVIAYNS